jgi:glycosyltransferase involved in cell wall biosynthesis
VNHLISVVIPTYNRAEDLKKAIESVLNQTYVHWELLIVDNYSTDHTREIINDINDKRIRFFELHNQGVISASRNLGFKYARGEFIAFLDSDDIWEKSKLEKSIYWLNNGYDIVYHDMKVVSNRFIYLGSRKFFTRQLSSPVFYDLLVNGNTLPTSSVIVKKDILDKIGTFNNNEDLIASEDYDLWLRVSEQTQRFKRVDGVLGSLYRGNDNQYTASRIITNLHYFEKNYLIKLSDEQRNQTYKNWINYSYGRSYYQQRRHSEARPYLLKVLMTTNSLHVRIKTIYMMFIIVAQKMMRQ